MNSKLCSFTYFHLCAFMHFGKKTSPQCPSHCIENRINVTAATVSMIGLFFLPLMTCLKGKLTNMSEEIFCKYFGNNQSPPLTNS